MARRPINTYGLTPKPVFGGTIEKVDGVIVETARGGMRFFIAIGQPGFNSPANNRGGYATKEAAAAACHRYNNK